ncbi:MAG: biopolymer transporter ExbD [Gammaproteobacteria bacterium]|nr:biopolymer transporter ExbD [Gammaproteobacteria bacterium]
MRKHIATVRAAEDDNEINLTPMLDVVFIMLIFFIVTATFIRESGLEAQRPDQNDQPQVTDEDGAILIVIDGGDDIFVDNQLVDMQRVRARIEAMIAEDPERPVVIQTHPDSTTKNLVGVLDAAHQADVYNVSIVGI